MIPARRIFSCIACIALALLLSASAMAQSGSVKQQQAEQQSRKARLEREIAIIQQQLKDNAGKSANALNNLTLVRKKVANRKALLSDSEKELRALDDSIAVREKQIAAMQARMDTMTYYYGRLVRNAYKNRDSRAWFMYILASRGVGQMARRYGYLRNLSGTMNDRAKEIAAARTELEAQLSAQKAQRARADELRKARQADLASMRSEEKEAEGLVSSLSREKSKYQKQLASKKRQVEDLNREIQKLIAGELGGSKSSKGSTAKTTGGKKTSKAIDEKLAAEFAANKGKLPWPCEGTVVEGFGQHAHPVYTSIMMPFNNGVNLAVPRGTKVQAVFNGEVRKVIVMPGYNKCVLVQHGGYFTFYCKLGSVSVKAGDKVKTGQVLGTVDTIDGQTQLHFQLWQNTKPQNPELWLKP